MRVALLSDRCASCCVVWLRVDAKDECDDPRTLMREVILGLAAAGARVAIGALRVESDLMCQIR